MIIGYSFFDGSCFETTICHPNYYSLELNEGVIDQVYADEDLNVDNSTTKPENFTYTTYINAKFRNNLEGGTIENSGLQVEKILLQKRKANELTWIDVGELTYEPYTKDYYEIIDKYVANDFEYEYSLVPITGITKGVRVISEPIRVSFDGYYLTDKDYNYKLIYNAELGSIDHIMPTSIFEPYGAKYPIVTYGTLDYRQGSLTALFLTDASFNSNQIQIYNEKTQRQNLMNFLKNRKPKIFRGMNGELMLIAVVDNPKEEPDNNLHGLAKVSFSFVEIGEINNENLRSYGLIDELNGV